MATASDRSRNTESARSGGYYDTEEYVFVEPYNDSAFGLFNNGRNTPCFHDMYHRYVDALVEDPQANIKYPGIPQKLNHLGEASFAYKSLIVTVKVSADDTDEISFHTKLITDKTNQEQVLQRVAELQLEQPLVKGESVDWDEKEGDWIYSYARRFHDIQTTAHFRKMLDNFLSTGDLWFSRLDPDTQDTEAILDKFTFQGEDLLDVVHMVRKQHIPILLGHAKKSETSSSLKAIYLLMVLAKGSSTMQQEMASFPSLGLYKLFQIFKDTPDSDSIRKTLLAMTVAHLVPALDATLLEDMSDAINECVVYLSGFQPVQFENLHVSMEDISTAFELGCNRIRQQEDVPTIVNLITACISDKHLGNLAQYGQMDELLELGFDRLEDPSKARRAYWLLMTMAQQSLDLRNKILDEEGLQKTCIVFDMALFDPPDMDLQGLAAMTVVYLLPSLAADVEVDCTDGIHRCLTYLKNEFPLSIEVDGNTVSIEEIRTLSENRVLRLYTQHVSQHLLAKEIQNVAPSDSKLPPKLNGDPAKMKPDDVKKRATNALELFRNHSCSVGGFKAQSQADYSSFETAMKEMDSSGLSRGVNPDGQKSGQEDVSSLLKELPACGDMPLRQLQIARTLLKFAEKDKDARNQMIEKDAISYLLLAFADKHKGNGELKTTVALTMAHLLLFLNPRKIPTLTKGKRQDIFRMLDSLQDSKQEILMEGTKISAQAIAYVALQARSCFALFDTSNEPAGTLGSNSTDQVTISPPLHHERNFGTVEGVGIESCLFFLGSNDSKLKLDAVMNLLKIAKAFPTQRALMHNYGIAARLIDIIRSVEDKRLKIAAAISLAYILPTLERSTLSSASNEAQECLQILESCGSNGITIADVNISSQEIEWAIEYLCNISPSSVGTMAARTNVTMRLQGQNEQFWRPFLGEAPSGSIILSTLDLEALYLDKNVTELVNLIHIRSCRMLDAALLLVALVNEDNEIGKITLTDENVACLLRTFFHWTSTSDELRLAVALVLCGLIPLSRKLPSDLKTYMSACRKFVQGKKIEEQRIVARSLYKVNPAAEFKFEPASYNYIQDDRTARTIHTNSLGIVCHSATWTWDKILDCVKHAKSGKSVRISLNDPNNLSVSFKMQDKFAAMQLVEDVLGRLKGWNSRTPSSAENQRASTKDKESFSVPCNLNISVADSPEFQGVSVYHLVHHFLPNVKSAGISAGCNFYELEKKLKFVSQHGQNTICPIDGKLGSSYVHWLQGQGQDHVGLANHMLSWTWSYSVRDVVNTLLEYCKNNKYDPKRVYVWICCLCLNQHRIAVAEDQSGIESNDSTVDFENEFKSRVVGIGRVLVMMRPWGDPESLKRVWCIFEWYMALVIQCELSIVMPSRESDQLLKEHFSSFGKKSDRGIHSVFDSLYKALNNIDVEKAQASVEKDRLRILGLIRETMGFQRVNMVVRDSVRGWARSVIDRIVVHRENIEQDPDTEDYDGMSSSKLLYCKFLKQVGDFYDHYGDFPAAHDMYQKCLSLRTSVPRMDRVDIAEAYTDLGRTLFSRGFFHQSWDMYMEALRIQENDQLSMNTARTYFHVGQLLQELGNMDDAKTMMESCLVIQEDLGRDRDAAKTRCHIALLLGESELDANQQYALEMVYEALRILAEENHPDMAFCYGVIARILQRSNATRALSLIHQCENIQERAYGWQHPSLFMTYTVHGDILRLEERLEHAYEEYSKALNIGSSPASIARTHANMSVVASILDRDHESVELHDSLLTILEASPDLVDQKLVYIYTSAGRDLFENKENYALAAVLFRRGLEVMEAMLGKDHANLAAAHESVALALYCNGDFAGAFIEYQRLHKMACKKMP